MNRNMRIATLVAVALAAGLLAGRYMGDGSRGPAETSGPEPQERQILYWVAPMDPNYRRDEPGKSPMGMDLVPVYADEQGEGDAIRISPALENNLGVRTQAAEVRPLWRRIEATGYVGFDETRVAHIHLRTEGWIEGLRVREAGERVRRGDLLFEFYSPQLVNAQKEYLQARRRGDARMTAAAEDKLRALGLARDDLEALAAGGSIDETVRVLAPQDGVVATLNVGEGMYVRPETEIMSLADLSSVWLQAEVFESQAGWVGVGQSAEARLNYMPGEVFSGEVEYVYPTLDPATRTLRVRLRFSNPDERLKPNMYADVTIYGETHLDALSIPREALIRGPERDRVVRAMGEGQYRVHEVMTGIESGEWVEIVAGLKAGDQVVTSAHFLLDSEASLSGSIQRLEGPGTETTPSVPASVFGSGRVEALDVPNRHVRVKHGPIEALGWPGMTMEFDVVPGISLERIQVGQSIHFSIRPNAEGVYEIDMVHLVDQPGVRDDD